MAIKTIPHTLGGFTGSFFVMNDRRPTEQEIFNAGMRAGRDINWPKDMIENDPMHWLMSETVEAALAEGALKRSYSCCAVPLKFCSTDQYTGELRAFSIQLLREALAYIQKQKETTEVPT